jgi:hypothetical protein
MGTENPHRGAIKPKFESNLKSFKASFRYPNERSVWVIWK